MKKNEAKFYLTLYLKAIVAIFFVIIITAFVHEAAHFIVAKNLGHDPKIKLVGSDISIYEENVIENKDHLIRIALAGPIINLYFALLSFAWLVLVYKIKGINNLTLFLLILGITNLIVGIMSLLPLPNSDGMIIWFS